jgi:hypothetical protein
MFYRGSKMDAPRAAACGREDDGVENRRRKKSHFDLLFEYGGLIVVNLAYAPSGAAGRATGKGWDRVRNVAVTPSSSDLALRQMMP